MSTTILPPSSSSIRSLFHPDPSLSFPFEDYLKNDLGIKLEKPPKVEVCQNYLKGICRLGHNCPFDHPAKTKLVVCKHWLRGLCKKGDSCEFLHEYNLKKMPECWFFVKLGECTNPECLYLHIDPASKKKECAWYARGFCKHGPKCRNKHIRRAPCPNYLTGYCPKGPNCSLGHPKFELPLANAVEDIQDVLQQKAQYEMSQRDQGNTNNNQGYQQQQFHQGGFPRPPYNMPMNMGGFRPPMNNGRFMPRPPFQFGQQHPGTGGPRNLSDVTCFKCGEQGHYANFCPKRRRMDGPQNQM